jgi:hypothetical protein
MALPDISCKRFHQKPPARGAVGPAAPVPLAAASGGAAHRGGRITVGGPLLTLVVAGLGPDGTGRRRGTSGRPFSPQAKLPDLARHQAFHRSERIGFCDNYRRIVRKRAQRRFWRDTFA